MLFFVREALALPDVPVGNGYPVDINAEPSELIHVVGMLRKSVERARKPVLMKRYAEFDIGVDALSGFHEGLEHAHQPFLLDFRPLFESFPIFQDPGAVLSAPDAGDGPPGTSAAL